LQIAPKLGLVPPWLMPPAPMMMPPIPGMFGLAPGAGMILPPVLPPAQQSNFKRADSSPLGSSSRETLPPSMVHSLSFVMSCGVSADMGLSATATCLHDSSILKLDMEPVGVLPIGLKLNKSASFVDLINSQLAA